MPEPPVQLSTIPDDIPEALREISAESSSSHQRGIGLVMSWLLGLGAIALLTLVFIFQPKGGNGVVEERTPPPPEPPPIKEPDTPPDNILGHLSYEEAPTGLLQAVTSDGRIRLRRSAAAKFRQMQAAARAEGVILTPISGFRSVQNQEYLFFKIKEERAQNTTKRAEVSAPPGYSEHHTGYAMDIGDGKVPATNLATSFENTAAFRWLRANAAKYSFELSFPKDNPQGISYEPWHWRFVGNSHSLDTFYKPKISKGRSNKGKIGNYEH